MIDETLIQKLLKGALGSGGDYADIFVEWRKPTFLQLEDRKVEKALSGADLGVGIRVIVGERTAYAYSNDLSQPALLEMVETLRGAIRDAAPFMSNIDLRVQNPSVKMPIAQYPHAVPMERKISLMRRADEAARGVDAEAIRQVTVIYKDSVQRVRIANSLGALCDDERVHTVGIVQVVAERGGVVQTGYEPIGGHAGFEIFNGEALEHAAAGAARRAIALIAAPRAPGGRMPVVIAAEAGGTMIHEAIGHGLEADLSGQGLSKYTGMLGQQVASTLVSVIDDATLPGKRGSYAFDDEGTPSERTVLVKDGILTGYMYDRLSAMRDGVASTGNGRRESYQSRPIPRMSNTFIAPGTAEPASILRNTSFGLYVRRMGGGQVNTVTGEFVFDVQEGFKIENGQIGQLVRGATLTGSGPEVLKSIDMVGSDLGFSIGTCGKDSQGVPVSDALPTIRIPEMVVGGEV